MDIVGNPLMHTRAHSQTQDVNTEFRTHSCGELRMAQVGEEVSLCGWVQTARDMNHFAFIDIRDRYGITQCVFNNPGDEGDAAELEMYKNAKGCGREFVIRVKGKLVERQSKNKKRDTGDVEVLATSLEILNTAQTPPFKIEDKTDAGEEIRMKYRYLDIRRNPIKDALLLRNQITRIVRKALNGMDFCEIETPVFIKSTPEGARDFVCPSRMNPGQFYALPQSPQTFKQLLMVAGMDRYFQIVKCFRDEELRADRQPEFTQIDCEMAFVTQDDVLSTFESMMRDIFRELKGVEFPPFQRMTWAHAMRDYGIDKPDIRFDMKLTYLTDIVKGFGLKPFDEAECVVGIKCEGLAASYSSKKIKALDSLAKSQQVAASGLVWVKCDKGGKFDSSAKKFYDQEQLGKWAARFDAKEGDLLCLFSGPTLKTQTSMGSFRNLMGTEMGLRDTKTSGYCALWVVDFPLLEWDEDEQRFTAMHHPFTSPHLEDVQLFETDPGNVRANAYDMCINGVEVGGGSIRVHDRAMQMKVFKLLGFTEEAAEEQFGFLLGAFDFGAPPHGGLAFGLDRLCTLVGGGASIRDYIAFPKNNQGRDTMINSPSCIADAQLEELKLKVDIPVAEASTPAEPPPPPSK